VAAALPVLDFQVQEYVQVAAAQHPSAALGEPVHLAAFADVAVRDGGVIVLVVRGDDPDAVDAGVVAEIGVQPAEVGELVFVTQTPAVIHAGDAVDRELPAVEGHGAGDPAALVPVSCIGRIGDVVTLMGGLGQGVLIWVMDVVGRHQPLKGHFERQSFAVVEADVVVHHRFGAADCEAVAKTIVIQIPLRKG